MHRIVTVSLAVDFFDEVHVSLKVTRVVSEGAEVLQLANINDVQGLKRLFSKGLASPNDVSGVIGNTGLSVSYYPPILILLTIQKYPRHGGI